MSEPVSEESRRDTLEGMEVEVTSIAQAEEVVRKARDYRGDVTLVDGDGEHEGFIFDLRPDDDPPVARMMLKEGGRVTIPLGELKQVVFSGRDTAFGKSWDAWMRRYEKLKEEGETPELYPEELD